MSGLNERWIVALARLSLGGACPGHGQHGLEPRLGERDLSASVDASALVMSTDASAWVCHS
jgi:hypothetical protein